MQALARLVLFAALPAFAGRGWCAGDVVSVIRGGGAESGPGGAGGGGRPAFLPADTALVAARGQDVEFECRVRALGDKAVSWVRSRDLQILSHAGAVFTADGRVSVRAGADEGVGAGAGGGGLALHTLRIQGLRVSDAGRYECQLNTDPKMSLFYNLTVLDEPVPVAVITALRARGAAPGAAVVAPAGGAVTLACEARYRPPPRDLPLPPLDVIWTKDGELLDLQSARGGVSLDTERWAWRVVSRLTLAQLAAGDGGAYTCALAAPRRASRRAPADTVLLHVQAEMAMEAMQRDQSADNGAGRRAGALPLPLPLLSLLSLLTLRLLDT